jgi:hypothetical protein
MLIKHHPNHLNYSAVLTFHDSILLRNTWGRKLLINTMLKAKLIERDIPKLGPIVTLNGFQVVGMFIVNLRKCSNTSSLLSKRKLRNNENSHQR